MSSKSIAEGYFMMRITNRRRGATVVQVAMMLPILVGLSAFAIDIARIGLAESRLQAAADAGALAAIEELPDATAAKTRAKLIAGMNLADESNILVDSDVEFGTWDGTNLAFTATTAANATAVRVTTRLSEENNNPLDLFLGPLMARSQANISTTATVAFDNNFLGFETPSDGSNLGMLPFALGIDTWNAMLAGTGSDDWTWDEGTGQVVSGSDGILEVNLFPQGTGSPGNRGTVDIGSNNNSTADIARQIVDGISPADFAYHGGELKLDENGELFLNADTGISAGVKDELESIKGQPRIIPLFSQVSGNGNNAMYTIVAFAGIRITEVKLTGQMSSKRVIIQPADVVITGGITAEEEIKSYYIYSEPRMVH